IPLFVTDAPLCSMSCEGRLTLIPGTSASGIQAHLAHCLFVRDTPPSFLRIIVDRNDGVIISRVGILLPAVVQDSMCIDKLGGTELRIELSNDAHSLAVLMAVLILSRSLFLHSLDLIFHAIFLLLLSRGEQVAKFRRIRCSAASHL